VSSGHGSKTEQRINRHEHWQEVQKMNDKILSALEVEFRSYHLQDLKLILKDKHISECREHTRGRGNG
jgi:hypothetical protein